MCVCVWYVVRGCGARRLLGVHVHVLYSRLWLLLQGSAAVTTIAGFMSCGCCFKAALLSQRFRPSSQGLLA